MLVTDHHLPGARLPDGQCHRESRTCPAARFGSRALAGVGVAFYVLAALQRAAAARRAAAAAARTGRCRAGCLLDLVALGTVADLVPLDANNRVLVAQGLRRIRAGRCVPGIRALLEVARARRRRPSPPRTWASRSGRGSMPPAASTT